VFLKRGGEGKNLLERLKLGRVLREGRGGGVGCEREIVRVKLVYGGAILYTLPSVVHETGHVMQERHISQTRYDATKKNRDWNAGVSGIQEILCILVMGTGALVT
jgi:hypothetical protein